MKTKKVTKKNVKTAIMIYEDPETEEVHRVIFGDVTQLIDFVIKQLPVVWKRISQMTGHDFEEPMDLIHHYYHHKEQWIKLHGIKAGDDLKLDISYEVRDK